MRTSHQHRRADLWGESGIMTGVSNRTASEEEEEEEEEEKESKDTEEFPP